MKRIQWLMMSVLLGGCLHAAPEATTKSAAPATATATAAVEKRPRLSAALVQKSIVKGKSTTKELAGVLGVPNYVEPNRHRPSKEILAKMPTPILPAVAAKEFWKYRTDPYKAEGSLQPRIFSVMLFVDDNGVVLDYLTDEHELAPQ